MFRAEDRERAQAVVLEWAAEDPRVVAGAVVGSRALGDGDRWSDLDLTFGVADGTAVTDVLEDWTVRLGERFDAVPLFDVPAGPAIYRVLLLPGALQLDLSFTPAAEFGARGPEFRLLFGSARVKAHPPPPDARALFGEAVHHALRARVCVERGRPWQAEYWVSGVRDAALSLACRRLGLPARYGRGYDALPSDVRDAFRDALVRSPERGELLRALGAAIEGLLREADEVRDVAARVERDLRALLAEWPPADGRPSGGRRSG